MFCGVCNTNSSLVEFFGIDGHDSTLRCANTIAGSNGTSPASQNALWILLVVNISARASR
jgi:hypothetical protein